MGKSNHQRPAAVLTSLSAAVELKLVEVHFQLLSYRRLLSSGSIDMRCWREVYHESDHVVHRADFLRLYPWQHLYVLSAATDKS